MRKRWLGVVVFALFVAGCEPTVSSPLTSDPVLPPPDAITKTTPPPPVSTTTVAETPLQVQFYQGYLPDGTEYEIRIESNDTEEVEGIHAAIVLDDGSDEPTVVGIALFSPGESQVATSYADGVYRMSAGGLAQIDFYDHVLSQLGPQAESVIRSSITGLTKDRLFPVVELEAPFRWATDDEIPSSMEIQYRNFVVRRGCGELAVACSETRAVQVIPADRVFSPASPWGDFEIYIDSAAPRPMSDPNYLDPGPLSERVSADLMWTGDEMIVWGGKTVRDGVPNLTNGAAFDPDTGEWRMLAPFPDSSDSIPNRAIWADSEMIVVGSSGTYGYNPGNDSWRRVAEAQFAPESNDRMLFDDGLVYVWKGSDTISVLDVDIGAWTGIEAPGSGTNPESWSGVLRGGVNGRVIAVTIGDDGLCFGKEFWQLAGDHWQPLPEGSLSSGENADCSTANQSASISNDLVIWDEEGHPSALYSTLHNTWRELPSTPLGGADFPSGPIPMDQDRFLVPQWGKSALFDANSDAPGAHRETWTLVTLPGQGTDAEIIWTGEEFLAWGIWGTFDAWRWTPDEVIFGAGSSTR